MSVFEYGILKQLNKEGERKLKEKQQQKIYF